MRVAILSKVSRVVHCADLPITMDQIRKFEKGTFVQEAFPNCNADQREFLLTGITPLEWQKVFGGTFQDTTVYTEITDASRLDEYAGSIYGIMIHKEDAKK